MLTSSTNSQGFTVIEAVFALIILLIGVVSVIELYPLGVELTSDSRSITQATQLATAQLESLQNLDYQDLPTGTYETKQRLSSDENSYLYTFFRETTISYIDSDLEETETDTGFKKISTTVYWLSPLLKNEKSIHFSLFRSDF